jgi:hypothetical protein
MARFFVRPIWSEGGQCEPTRDDLVGFDVCAVHGGIWTEAGCLTQGVLADVAEHREFQYGQYGPNRDVPDGTGQDVPWLAPIVDAARTRLALTGKPITAYEIEGLFREEWDYPKDGTDEEKAVATATCTWMRMLREEVAEAFAQSDDRWLEEELIQVAALAVSWVERLRERRLTGVMPS